MRKHIKKITDNPLIAGSAFIFLGGIFASFLSFLTNIVFSRNLSLSDYGAYVSVVSLILLAVIPASSVVPAIVALAGPFYAHYDHASIKALYFKFIKPIFLIGLLLSVFFIVFIKPIGEFLHLQNQAILIVSFIAVLLGFVGTVNLAFLQSRLSFKILSFSNIISSAARLIAGGGLVVMGIGLNGALTAFFISSLIPVVIGFVSLRKVFTDKFEKIPHISYKSLLVNGIPSVVSVFAINSFISTDIILVKHFFSPEKAGLYAGLSLIGKVIFYLTAPIGNVMFPIAVRKFSMNENFNKIFILAISLVGGIGICMVAFYFIFPEFTTLFFLKNKEYSGISSLLGLYGIYMALYSLLFVVMYFFLSIKKNWVSYLMLVGSLLQAMLIWFLHDDFPIIIGSSIFVVSLLLIILLLYYVIAIKTHNVQKKGN